MDLDEDGVKALVKDKEGELGELRTQMGDDYDLYVLDAYQPVDSSGNSVEGYQAYTTSQPRNFFDKVTDAINRAELSIQIKTAESASTKERRDSSNGELFLFGALNDIDRSLRRRGEPPLRETLSFLMNLRGWLALRALVYNMGDRTIFDVLPWDILHMTWESGPNGLLWAANKRKITKAQIKAEYDKEINDKDAELIDFWCEEKNSIIIGDEFVKPPTPHDLGHVPVFVASVGSMPTLQKVDGDSTIKNRGDSVWAASRNLYEPFNRVTSRIFDFYERAAVGSVIHTSKRGDKKIVGDPYRTFQEIQLSTEDNEEILPFPSAVTPTETAILHSIVNTDIQTSTLPYPLAYGGTKQAMSGAALSVLSDATRSVYNPRCGVLGQAYTWLCEELLLQYSENGSPATLSGHDEKEHFFTVKVKPKQINPDWYVSVRVEPRMPRDMEAEIMMSLAATQRRGPEDIPLISKQTAREDILKIRDPDAEEDKALAEMGKAHPAVMASQVAGALARRGEKDLARDYVMALNPEAAQGPQIDPNDLMAALEGLQASGNPELQQLADMIVQKYSGQAPPQGQPPPQQPPQQTAPPM